MLRNILLVTTACVATGLSLLACGGGGDTSTGSGGGSTTKGEEPPARPSGMTPGDGQGETVFAISKLYLGDTDRNGTVDKANGWKNYGYDLDGHITDCSGSSCEQVNDQCKPAAGGSPAIAYPDGNNGIDNSFGENILPIILGIASDASSRINDSIAQGTFTIMIDIAKLGSKSEYNPLLAKLYGGADLMHPPKFDGTDKWPLLPELLKNPSDPSSAQVQFPNSYVTNNTWVSGDPGTVTLKISISGFDLQLDIQHALLSFEMASDHKSASNGTVAGVLDTQQLVTELKQVAGSFDPSLCSGSTIDSIVNEIEQASDIMKNGTAGSSSDTCDGISIGLGFDAKLVQLGPVAPKAMPMPNPCNM